MTWQTIDSAPKDGTVIDLFADGKRLADCHWGKETEGGLSSHVYGGVGWVREDCDVTGTWYMDLVSPEPTHWMPLPAPPPALEHGGLELPG